MLGKDRPMGLQCQKMPQQILTFPGIKLFENRVSYFKFFFPDMRIVCLHARPCRTRERKSRREADPRSDC